MKHLINSSIAMYGAITPKTTIEVPEATPTHFYTSGRIVSYFPQVNANGYTFLKEDTEPKASTLESTTVDIQHVKKGYGVTDPLVANTDNAIIGAISKYVAHEDGIDILVKIDRSLALGFGFSPEDFEPGKGLLASYSQECEFDKTLSNYIVVDKNDPAKIIRTISYADGQALGLELSHQEEGKWKFSTINGDPVYMAVKPMSFAGVGHVARPADPSATVSKMNAAAEGKILLSFVPGMDGENAPANDMARPFMTADAWSGNDLTQYTQDFVMHPDLVSGLQDPKIDKIHGKPEDPKAPDDHFAASWSTAAEPAPLKHRAFPIKDDKGNFDRASCIAAYHAIQGIRGNTAAADQLPFNVRQHALARVRFGLQETKPKPKITKENSSTMELTDEQLAARIKELSTARNLSTEDALRLLSEEATHAAAVVTLTAAAVEKDTALAAKDTEITNLQAKIKEFTDEKSSAERFTALDKVLAFTEEEKKDEKFPEFVKNLAALTETDFKIMSLERHNSGLKVALATAAAAPDRVLSGLPSSIERNPVPEFKGADGKPEAASILNTF